MAASVACSNPHVFAHTLRFSARGFLALTKNAWFLEVPLNNNWDKIAPRFVANLDVTIEKKPRHSTAMLRLFRLRRVQRCPEDGMGFCLSFGRPILGCLA